jgi:creatinine amidohydrolase
MNNRAMALQAPSRTATMLDMSFPEFEAAVKKTDVLLLPIGSIEEHGASLPLSTDAITAVGQCNEVQRYLRTRGFDTIVGPPLNIGLTNENGDFGRSGTYIYPGSLTVRVDTFVALYLDVLRALRDSGVRTVFLFSGHSGGAQQRAVARIAEEASNATDGMRVYALMPSENIERAGVNSSPSLIVLDNYRNFELLGRLLGNGTEPPRSTHADGAEISLMLYYRPDMVRRGYEKLPQSPSSKFFAAVLSGDRADNPSGMGGFPSAKASAAVGKAIVDYRTALMGDMIVRVLAKSPPRGH